MMQALSDKAGLLVQALPYIQKYNKKTIVVKYGGNAMINKDLKKEVIKDLVLMRMVGINIVVVHGGGPEISDMLKRINKESRFINGLRYTDWETMDIVQQVLCGKVNKTLVSLINNIGGRAMGLCGLDGNMIRAVQLVENGVDYGLVGEITDIDPDPVNDVIDKGYIPVISTVASGADGNEMYNVNADIAAARLAVALDAIKLVLLTDVRGILLDPEDEGTLIGRVSLDEISGLKDRGILSGGMIPKVECCAEAVKGGVKRAHIIDGRIRHSILIETLSDEGIGTMISRN